MQNEFVEIFSKFLPVAVRILQLKSLPTFEFTDYMHHDEQPTFGMYVNDNQTLYVALAGRHPNDILRTIAHELTHHKQNINNELDDQSGDTGSPEENEANAQAGIIMRHFNRMYPEYLKVKPLMLESQQDESLKGLAAAGLLGLGMLGGPKDVASGNLPQDLQKVQQQHRVQMAKKPMGKPMVKPVQAKPLPAKATPLLKAAKASGIKGVELAQFLAQMEHESLDFKKMKEIGKATYFNKYDPKHNPRLATKLGNKYKGDGVTFKGRGFIQLTGRENYTQASYDIFGDNRLVKKPDLAAQPDIAARIAVWYWSNRVKPLVKDFTDTTRVTKIINGGLNGLEDRENNFKEYMASLSLREDISMARQNLVIFDIDDTLLHTTAKIKVINAQGQVIRTLTNQEFNNYVLQPGEQFDFGEFRDAEKFNRESQPIKPMMNRLKDVLANSPNAKAIMLTARADFDDKDKFLSTFKKYGVDMSRVHVHRAGNIPGDAIPAEKKAVWVRKYLNTGKYKAVWLYDDSRSNLSVFKDLKNEYPDVDFHAVYVGPKGETSRVEGR